MKCVAIFGRTVNERFKPCLDRLISGFETKNIKVLVDAEFARVYTSLGLDFSNNLLFTNNDFCGEKPDMILSIGGDGTFLDAVSFVMGLNIPILGINSGRMGFLANVAANDITAAVESVCLGNYKVEDRDLLSLTVNGEVVPQMAFAFNEVSVQKSEMSSLLKIRAFVNDIFLTDYWADGLVVATPSGSTAYSMSAGGPIVSPDCNNVILTPICPHNLTMRPIVIPANATIKLKVESRSGIYLLATDSRMKSVKDSVEIKIESAVDKVKIVKLPGYNFYDTLRKKLMWGEDVRNAGLN